jgi:hypothetical protein
MTTGSDKSADEREIGTSIPPYDGRTTSAATHDDADEPDERKQRFATEGEGMRSSGTTDPAATPGGRTASPAEEVPAADVTPQRPQEDAGVGPAHLSGSSRAEDVGEQQSESGRSRSGRTGETDRPVGEAGTRDQTGINPEKEEPST